MILSFSAMPQVRKDVDIVVAVNFLYSFLFSVNTYVLQCALTAARSRPTAIRMIAGQACIPYQPSGDIALAIRRRAPELRGRRDAVAPLIVRQNGTRQARTSGRTRLQYRP